MRIPVALRGGNCEAGKVSNRHDPGQVGHSHRLRQQEGQSQREGQGQVGDQNEEGTSTEKSDRASHRERPRAAGTLLRERRACLERPSDYANYVFALQVLAHELIHLYDFRSGGPIDQPFEIRAECQGMQWLTRVATSLGTTADDAQAIANYYHTVIYPTRKTLANGPYPYWSADCHHDGPLDVSPGDGVWP
jgi:hypothetical protein